MNGQTQIQILGRYCLRHLSLQISTSYTPSSLCLRRILSVVESLSSLTMCRVSDSQEKKERASGSNQFALRETQSFADIPKGPYESALVLDEPMNSRNN